MMRPLAIAFGLVVVSCSSQAPTPPPGVVVGPDGVQVPGVTVGPGGITAPGVTVGPGGITAPGVSIPAPVGGVAVPGAPADAPLGIAECDQYVQRACSCSNEAARATTCSGARVSLQGWRGALAVGADRATITQSCASAATALAAACP